MPLNYGQPGTTFVYCFKGFPRMPDGTQLDIYYFCRQAPAGNRLRPARVDRRPESTRPHTMTARRHCKPTGTSPVVHSSFPHGASSKFRLRLHCTACVIDWNLVEARGITVESLRRFLTHAFQLSFPLIHSESSKHRLLKLGRMWVHSHLSLNP